MRESGEKSLSQLTPAQRNQLSKKYEKFLLNHQKALKQFV